MRDVFSEHADAILTAWSKPFDQAARTIGTCHQRIGDIPLEDTATIVQAGGDIASVWAQAQAAAAVLDSLAGVWVALANLTGFAPIHPRLPALRIATATPEEWAAVEFERKTPGAWTVQLAGLTLSLADGSEYVRRVAAIERAEAVARQQEQPKDRSREALKEWASKTDAARLAAVV
jgi:hypothetical protein